MAKVVTKIVSSPNSVSPASDLDSSRLGWAGPLRPPEVPEPRPGHRGGGLSLDCQQRPLQSGRSGGVRCQAIVITI